MSLVVSWLLAPLVLGLLSLGCGLLVGFAAGVAIPRSLLLPLGFCALVVVSLATTAAAATARLTTPVVVLLAVAGLVLARRERPARSDGWAAAAAAATFAALGAPVFLSGSATFAGYIKLDDTATWLGFTDRLLEHGRNVHGLPPSTYEAALDANLVQNGYPAGIFPPLGILHQLLRTDSAWLFQPYVAFLGALLALALYGLSGRLVESAPLRAFVAFIAAQPALLYGYSLWGGVKEEAVAALVALVAALAPDAVRERARARALLPLALATAALLGILGVLGAVWVAPILLAVLAVGIWLRRRAFVRITAAFAAFAVVLSVPTLLLTGRFLDATGVVTSAGSAGGLGAQADLGNLVRPLSDLQVFGIWPAGDFRLRPTFADVTYALVALVVVAALAGLWMAWRRRAWAILLYVLGAGVGAFATVVVGSPWVDAKALAIASPVALVVALGGLAALAGRGRRAVAGVVIAVIAGGVCWSNALAYHDVWLAPRGQLHELELVGQKFAGDGPALMTDYSPYGARHFLRKLDPESASDLRYRPVTLHSGQLVAKGGYADIDAFDLADVLVYRTLVLVHAPSSSRPPSLYRLVWSGSYYDVWQRPETPSRQILEHVSLGDDTQPGGTAPCSQIEDVGRLAAAQHGHVVAVVRSPVTVDDLARSALPPAWQPFYARAGGVYPLGPGTIDTSVTLTTGGAYDLWLDGSFHPQIEVRIDGRPFASVRDRLNRPGQGTPLGHVELAAGHHTISLHYGGASLRPGSAGVPFGIGPLLLSPVAGTPELMTVAPAQAHTLCGRRLDWIEAVTGAS